MLGCVRRDSEGKFLVARTHVHLCLQPREEKAFSVQAALVGVQQRSIQNAIIETKSQLVVNAITSSDRPNSLFDMLVKRSQSLS